MEIYHFPDGNKGLLNKFAFFLMRFATLKTVQNWVLGKNFKI